MATTEEELSAIKAHILDLEKALEELKSRPQTPDTSAELKAVRDELTHVRKELSSYGKPKSKSTAAESEEGDDVSLGHFSPD